MLRKSLIKLILAATAPLMPLPAFAADEDANIWLAAVATADVGRDIVISVDGAVRWTDDAKRLGQYLVRVGMGKKLGPNTIVTIGYVYSHSDPPGRAVSDEHRFWQQMTYRLVGNGKGVTLTGRTRMEQRWVEGRSDTGWRLRQQLRATAPLRGKVRAVVWSEAFFSLDDTSWGQRKGIDRWRNAGGLSIPITKVLTLEPSYIHQRVARRGEDRVNHIAQLNLSARF